uniref:Nuclear transcription factor Y subunit gamma n=1 Tax=Sciurus vulgaris TaxID=55149 RepID=A0A8D2D6Z0_SCIVU
MSTEGGFAGISSSDAQQSLQSFWPRVMEEVRNLTVKNFRVQELPLARIKKIMKLDEDVKRNDISMAITKFDQFDFLIDIFPRDELKPPKRQEEVGQSVTPAEPVQYYFTLAQQPTAKSRGNSKASRPPAPQPPSSLGRSSSRSLSRARPHQ